MSGISGEGCFLSGRDVSGHLVESGEESHPDSSSQGSPNLWKWVTFESGNQAVRNPKEETVSV